MHVYFADEKKGEGVPMNPRGVLKVIGSMLLTLLSGLSPQAEESQKQAFSMGNGANNWIDVAGVTRSDSVLTFPEVQIDGNGWLVIHPFEDGKPNGDKYVAQTYLKDGINKNVNIDVLKGLTQGEMFIVMLHRDLNENKVLDFIFIDDTNVMDRAVFEGSRMIGHAIPAP
jgi:hypothetical protein